MEVLAGCLPYSKQHDKEKEELWINLRSYTILFPFFCWAKWVCFNVTVKSRLLGILLGQCRNESSLFSSFGELGELENSCMLSRLIVIHYVPIIVKRLSTQSILSINLFLLYTDSMISWNERICICTHCSYFLAIWQLVKQSETVDPVEGQSNTGAKLLIAWSTKG